METESADAVNTLTPDMSLIDSQTVAPGLCPRADPRPGSYVASPLGVTPSITLMAPSGIVTRTVIGMAPGLSDATSAIFSGRTELSRRCRASAERTWPAGVPARRRA